MKERDGEYIYIIPHNYTDNGKIFGIIEPKSLYLAGGWFVPLTYLIFWWLPLDSAYKIFIWMIFVAPVTVFMLVGMGSDTLIDFLKYVRNYYKNAKYYVYKK